MIDVSKVRKRFGEVLAVDDVSFTAADGQVTGLLGPNGAGKTTTLRMLYGLIEPLSGAVSVDGVDVWSDPLRAQRKIGALPDTHGLYPRLTAREHLDYFGRLRGLSRAELRRRVDVWIERLEMGDIAGRRAAGFSQGERMKVNLARALIHDPRNVLLDEPTNGLDVMTTRAVRELIRELKAEGRAVLFSSHVMQEVAALCDAIVIIAKGRVVATGSLEAIRARAGTEDLEEAFVRLAGADRGEP
jgi:sodium transport system ATP-binding protein